MPFLLAILVFAAGGLATSQPWRMAAMRVLVPGVPQAPMLPDATVAYGTATDRDSEYLSLPLRPVESALRARLGVDLEFGRLRGFRYLWPHERAVGRAFSVDTEQPDTLFGDMIARAKALGWTVIDDTHEHYITGSAIGFAKGGYVFAIAVGNPTLHETFEGGGRSIVVPVFGTPKPVGDTLTPEYVPMFVMTNVFDPDAASFAHSVVAPFLPGEAPVRMRLRGSADHVMIDRAEWEAVCMPPAGRSKHRYDRCVDLRARR